MFDRILEIETALTKVKFRICGLGNGLGCENSGFGGRWVTTDIKIENQYRVMKVRSI